MKQFTKKLLTTKKPTRFYMIITPDMTLKQIHERSIKNRESLKNWKEKLHGEPKEGDFIFETPSWEKKPNLKYTKKQGIEIYKKLQFTEEEINEIKSIGLLFGEKKKKKFF